MNNFKNKLLSLTIFLILIGCSSLGEARKVMRNEKVKTADEFLVKKKDPLAYPPDYDKIPTPGSLSGNKKTVNSEEKKLKEIFKIDKEKKAKNPSSKSIEDSILKKINK